MEQHPIHPDAVAFAASQTPVTPASLPTEAPPERTFLTFEPRTEAIRRTAERVEQGVAQILADPNAWVSIAGRFHQYSINNQILIMMQRPDATKVASKDRWAAMGRFVKPEELTARNGIEIFFPIFKEREDVDADTGELVTRKALVGFGVGKTWDMSQTDGQDLPAEKPLVERLGLDDAAKEIDRRVTGHLLGQGLTLTKVPLVNARGFFAPHTGMIGLNQDLPFGDILTTKTLMHEFAHYQDDHQAGVGDRRDREVLAELSATIAMAHFGFDTAAYSHDYIAHWAGDMDRLRANLTHGQKLSHKLISRVEGERPDEMSLWW